MHFLVYLSLWMGCNDNSNHNNSFQKKSIDNYETKELLKNLKAKKNEKNKFQEEIFITISQENISFKNINFKDIKSKMKQTLGIPDSIIEPQFECGIFSEEEQGTKFHQYFYQNINFIGYQDTVEIFEIQFNNSVKLKINQGEIQPNMSFEEVVKQLKIKTPEKKYNKNYILLYPQEFIDEYYILIFKNNLIYKFERYDPC